jgi:hypothetical protein
MTLCADGILADCRPGSREPTSAKLHLPRNRRVAIHVALGFVPKSVVVTLTPTSERERVLRPTAKPTITFRIPPTFRGRATVFATSRSTNPGGDVFHGVCVRRRSV